MASPFQLTVTAAQVGTYFVGQYYQVVQNQPDYAYQFYSEASTMLRIDGNTRETATGMLQIHAVLLSLNYAGIEINTAHSLESWSGGVLVVVSGSVHLKNFHRRKKFVQTFFLAPQDKGFFVFNDVFHFVEEDEILQHPMAYLAQSTLESKLNAPISTRDQVSNYMLGGDIQGREYVTDLAPAKLEENGLVENYVFAEDLMLKATEAEKMIDNFVVQSNGYNSVLDHYSVPIEEPVEIPQKHTYASIVAKGQPAPAVGPTLNNKVMLPSEWEDIPEQSQGKGQTSVASSNSAEKLGAEIVEEPSVIGDYEFEEKSVYVRNVPTAMPASAIEDEFKKFGKLKPNAVAIRTRKDIDLCYAFVEFEDNTGVQNAIQAYSVEIDGHQLYIEGRRPNRNMSSRGRGRGRGRFGYHMMGRFGGRSYSRGYNQDGKDRDFNRSRGNGYHRHVPRQERAYSGNRNGVNLSVE